MGAWILGRNMFGPVRGPWPDESWSSGEALFTGLDLPSLGYAVTEHVASEKATHVVISKRG